jgi:drug/metabolite transporter (DMT)-like permease
VIATRWSPGLRFMVAAAFSFSLMSALAKAVGSTIPSQEIVLLRGVFTVALSYGTLRVMRIPARGNRPRLLIVRGLFGFAALSAFFYAVVHLPLAAATVIHFTNPVFTAMIAAVVLAEPIRMRDSASVVASLAGVVLIARPDFLFGGNGAALDPLAVGIALAGAILSACAYVTVRRLSATEHPLVIVHYFAVVTTLGAAPTAAANLVWPSPIVWLGLAGVGITTHVAQLCMTRGLSLEPAGRAMAVGYLQIVFATVWGLLFFSERPDALSAVGAFLIIGSTALLGRRRAVAQAGAPGGQGRDPSDGSEPGRTRVVGEP